MTVEGLKSSGILADRQTGTQEIVKDILGHLAGSNRNLVSDEFEEGLEYFRKYIDLNVHRYKTGSPCWTWNVPPKWRIRDGYIKHQDRRIVSFKEHPLHVMSYSVPVNKTIPGKELLDHVYVHKELSDAIPYEFSFYVPKWGFCLTHDQRDAIKEDEMYEVCVESEFVDDYLSVGEYTVQGKSDEHIFFLSHLDHPCQANDGLTGCAVNVALAMSLKDEAPYYNYTFLFVPETIGSIAYLSHHEHLIPKIRYAVFNEATGLDNPLVLQESYENKGLINQYALYAMKKLQGEARSYPYLSVLGNEEKIFNSPGVHVPSISVTRINQESRLLKKKRQKAGGHELVWPYPEYHSHRDDLGLVNFQRVHEAVDCLYNIFLVMEKDFIPIRNFKGPVFLSGYDLWVDWRKDAVLSDNMTQVMYCLEGDKTVFQIAQKLNLDFEKVRDVLNRFYDKGLIDQKRIPIGFDR